MSTGCFNILRRAIVISCAAALPAFAGVQDNGLFELGDDTSTPSQGSADILGSSTQPGPDWADIFDGNGNVINSFGGEAAAFIKDDLSASSAIDTTVYSGGPGDKNQDKIADWTWTSSSVPVKNDIANNYAYAKKDANGHLIIYVGAERLSPNGDSHIDVEFFQNPVGLDHAVPCPGGVACHFTGTNRDGDILVNMDFTNGGAFAGLTVRARQEGAPNNYVALATLNAQGCNSDGTVCAFVNGGSIDGGPWPNFDSHGAVISQLPTNAFTEWGVDVSALLGRTNLCFSTVQVKTRSSQSFTATLKDFALHEFQKCVANAVTQIHSGPSVGASHTADDIQNTSVAVGTTVHDKAIVTGTAGAPTPTGSVVFNRFTNGTCGAPPAASETVALSEVSAPTGSDPGVAAAESGSFATTTSGDMSYQAVYSGDSAYPGTTSACEKLTVNRVNSAVNTDIRLNTINGTSVLNQKVNAGTIIVDVGAVTGNAPNGSGGIIDPTGTLTIERFATPTCTGTAVATENVALPADADPNGSSTAASAQYTTLNGEFVGFKVTYSGDAVYNPSSATVCEPICSFSNSPPLP